MNSALLTVKYAEVTVRYPEGGGVVTVATHAIGPFAGLLGGLFILVDYFLTAALSALSGLIYFSLVAPALKPIVLPATLVALAILALLNLVGIDASAEASAVVATIAGASQLLVVLMVVIHLGPGHVLATIPRAFSGPRLRPLTVLTGYAGAFLAFSGLESIAQLAPSMRAPRSHLTMGAVIATIALTSPLLTLWSTTLLNAGKADPNQFISLLGGYAAGQWLQVEVAITAAVLLVFASNTALIGTYHVFLALSRMHFLPRVIAKRNRWRDTPHWAILVGVAVPMAVLVASAGSVGLLGDLYAFGLLGAFSMTCISLDIVRWHERHPHRRGASPAGGGASPVAGAATNDGQTPRLMASRTKFTVGAITSALVTLAWITNLFAKPLATLFGGGVTIVGLIVAFTTYRLAQRRGEHAVFPLLHRQGQPPFFLSRARKARPTAVLAVLPRTTSQTARLVRAAGDAAAGRPIIFRQRGTGGSPPRLPRLFEVVDPYLDDRTAQESFGTAEQLSRTQGLDRRYIYLPATSQPDALAELWRVLRPEQTLVLAGEQEVLRDLNADRVQTLGDGPEAIFDYRKEWQEFGS